MGIDYQAAREKLKTLALASGLGGGLFDAAGRRLFFAEDAPGAGLCRAACGTREGLVRCGDFHAGAGHNAWRSGAPYIARCPFGAVVITAALNDGGRHAGAAALFPLRLTPGQAPDAAALARQAAELGLEPGALWEAAADVPTVAAARAEALGRLLYQDAEVASEPLPYRGALDDQEKQLRALLETHPGETDAARAHDYPIQLEREMLGRVRLGDKSGARAMLNELLAHIFLRSPGNLELIKARLLELVVMISRAAVESGAELDRLLGLNYNFISEAAAIDDYEELSAWIVKVLDVFLETVYDSRTLAGSRQLTDALSYIRQHHMQNLTLEDVAAQVYVSPYYLSHLFKEKLGVTFVEYLTRVRVEMAKSYLLNTQLPVAAIAERVGYEDPSYFGKVFRRLTGSTPKGFRRGG